MTDYEAPAIHKDVDFFRAAAVFTEAKTGFNSRLVEKDYFCTAVLHGLRAAFASGLVFKGGTSLSKIHCDFYRLSEDLDFHVSIPVESTRSVRSKTMKPLGECIELLVNEDAGLLACRPLQGHNNSTQYTTEIEYQSVVFEQPDRIKLEISVREPILEAPQVLPCRTLLLDPFRSAPLLPPLPIPALSPRESYAEKLRAAMTRREPAIRDFFDVDYAVRNGAIDLEETRLIEMVRSKLAVPGNNEIDLTAEKARTMGRQVQGQLRPVLRQEDFESFDLDAVFSMIQDFADRL